VTEARQLLVHYVFNNSIFQSEANFHFRGTRLFSIGGPSGRQRWPESHFQTPTPLLFQNVWIRIRVRKFSNLWIRLQLDPVTIDAIEIQQNFYCASALAVAFFRFIEPLS